MAASAPGAAAPHQLASDVAFRQFAGGDESVPLSHAQLAQLELLFTQHYVERLAESRRHLGVAARVSVVVGGKRRYGKILSVHGANALIVFDGRDSSPVEHPLDNVILCRERLSRSTKRRWAREVCVLGGTEAVAWAYRKWVVELRQLLLIAQHKHNVLAALVGREVITRATVRDTCAGIFGPSAANDATALIYNAIKDDSVLFKRRRGQHESFAWTAEGIRRYPPLAIT
jgi:hypothetical protein